MNPPKDPVRRCASCLLTQDSTATGAAESPRSMYWLIWCGDESPSVWMPSCTLLQLSFFGKLAVV